MIVLFFVIIIGVISIKDFGYKKTGHNNHDVYLNKVNTQNEEQESDHDDELTIEENNSNSVTLDEKSNVDDNAKEQEIFNNNDNLNNNNNNRVSNNQEVSKDKPNDSNTKEETSDEMVEEKFDIPIQKIEFINSFEHVPFSKNKIEKFTDFQDVIFYPNDATNKEIIWSSSDPDIASIESGKIKLNDFGTVTITATSMEGNHSANYEIKIVGQMVVSPQIALGYDGTSIVFQLKTSTAQLGFMKLASQKRFIAKINIYKDNELFDEVELREDHELSIIEGNAPHYVYVTHMYKTVDCINGEYYMEYIVIDQLSGYQVSGKSNYSKRITCVAPIDN